MIGQSAITLTKGKSYTLSFDASASTAVSAVTTVQLADAPYTNTLTQPIALTTTSKRFSFPFTAGLGTPAGQVSFQLGKNAGFTFFVDNVSLTESAPTTPPGSGPVEMTDGFYVDPGSNPALWVNRNPGAKADRIKAAISSKPMARWFGGWSGDIRSAVSRYVADAAAARKLPILVAYNIYGRDACGEHSSGGAPSEAAYLTWISEFAAGIGNRPAVVVIEPDSLGDFACMDSGEITARKRMLNHATRQFRDKAANTWAYLDAANAGWTQPATMAGRLRDAGVGNVRGFAVNVSNYYTTADSARYGDAVSTALGGGVPFVIDTSRNGKGSNNQWCNPPGRQLGTPARVGGGAEMLLWVKVPGDSDGPCGVAPTVPAGTFSPDLAIRLIDGA
jgi:endoglucanase